MKLQIYILNILLAALLISGCRELLPKDSVEEPESSEPVVSQRESITFILGEDEPGERYFTPGREYFLSNEKNRTDHLSDTCRSLLSVRNYLLNHPPSNGLPWGKINLLTHGNPWLGLDTEVFPGSMRANEMEIRYSSQAGILNPLPDSILDVFSEIEIIACGVGYNQTFLESIRTAFGGPEDDPHRPLVVSGKQFVSFEWEMGLIQMKKYDAFFAFHPENIEADPGDLAQSFRRHYSSENISWEAILTNPSSATGRFRVESFRVPILWRVPYPSKSARPDISSEKLKQVWLGKQEGLDDVIHNMGISKDLFSWEVQKTLRYPEGGGVEAFITATGMCRVVCVLREKSQNPINASIQ